MQQRDFQDQLIAEQAACQQVNGTLEVLQQVRKCLDNWLKQGIICPSKSPYASQVVIVRKKTGEICLCINFRKLNAISI